MPLDHGEDAYQACGSESTATNHSEATEDDAPDTATEDLRNLSNNPISSPRSTDSQSLVARNGHDDTHLCQRCHELEFESKFISTEKHVDFNFEIGGGTLDSACILCKLFARVRPLRRVYFHIEGLSDPQEVLFVERTPSLRTPGLETYSCSKSGFGLFPQKPWSLDLAKVDFDTLRKKFEHCKAKHTKMCCPGRVPVKNLRVFNCSTKKLEHATVETKYAALSYVWGNLKTSHEYPQTIQDAFEVAQKFGLQYIWIDQLCIDQEGSHKAEQIRQMHHIYSNAELTIIAATGYDSAYGIPGVNGKLRTERGDFEIGRLRFVQHYPDLKGYGSTYWGTRGWTFQEEILSSRLLIFTDYEAFFACPRTPLEYGREHLDPNFPDKDWESYLKIEYREHEDHGRNLEFPDNITNMIGDYSARTLTYETDVINAFSGCLGMLEQAEPPVYHLWGSPIPLHPARGSLDWFQIGLQWTREMGSSSLRRRAGFPSWSWTGWIGRVSMLQYHYMDQTHEGSHTPDISVALELETGERLDWLDVEKRSFLKDQPELISRFIFLRAWTTLITLEFYPLLDSRKMRLYAVIKTIHGGEAHCPAVLLSEGSDPDRERIPPLEKKDFTGILMPSATIHGRKVYIMLVSKADESEADESEVKDHYVRVGYAELFDIVTTRDGAGNISKRDWKDLEPLQRERKEIRLG